jgi:hypothetical protein
MMCTAQMQSVSKAVSVHQVAAAANSAGARSD